MPGSPGLQLVLNPETPGHLSGLRWALLRSGAVRWVSGPQPSCPLIRGRSRTRVGPSLPCFAGPDQAPGGRPLKSL